MIQIGQATIDDGVTKGSGGKVSEGLDTAKILGIDMGTKRIGLALSNPEANFAFPFSIIEVKNVSRELDHIVQVLDRIIAQEHVAEIVIGESKDFKGKHNPIMDEVHALMHALKTKSEYRERLAIHLEPEFMTSQQAERHQGKHDLLDASAATIILQSFLDRRRHTKYA